MKRAWTASAAVVGVVGALIAFAAVVPRFAFLLLCWPSAVVVGVAFVRVRYRTLSVVCVAVAAMAIAVARIDVFIEHGRHRGITFERVIWGRMARPPADAYFPGCEPPRFEPMYAIVVRL